MRGVRPGLPPEQVPCGGGSGGDHANAAGVRKPSVIVWFSCISELRTCQMRRRPVRPGCVVPPACEGPGSVRNLGLVQSNRCCTSCTSPRRATWSGEKAGHGPGTCPLEMLLRELQGESRPPPILPHVQVPTGAHSLVGKIHRCEWSSSQQAWNSSFQSFRQGKSVIKKQTNKKNYFKKRYFFFSPLCLALTQAVWFSVSHPTPQKRKLYVLKRGVTKSSSLKTVSLLSFSMKTVEISCDGDAGVRLPHCVSTLQVLSHLILSAALGCRHLYPHLELRF